MTSKELDERIEEYVSSHQYIDGDVSLVPTEHWQPELKQLIRDCIEAVTPDKRKTNDTWLDSGYHRAIDTIQANTKELLAKTQT